jgi:hypothetical protein
MTYLLDANVFIQAKNLHYGFDFCPAFWRWLERENDGGRVLSTEKVGDELIAGNDELAKWAETRGERFFMAPDSTVVPALTRVSTWATTKGYEPAAVATFLQVADRPRAHSGNDCRSCYYRGGRDTHCRAERQRRDMPCW